jgi:hypothetical protein
MAAEATTLPWHFVRLESFTFHNPLSTVEKTTIDNLLS